MNKIENVVYNLVRKNPALKQTIRNLYQGCFDLLPRQKNYFSRPYQYKEGYFFGFHDITPWNDSENKLLAHHADFDQRMPKSGETIDIGYFDFSDNAIGKWHKVAESMAWNWHKGARLQWIDNKTIIFNTTQNNKPISRILNIETGEDQFVEFPIDAVYKNKKIFIATSFSYERLQRCMPGYGYPYKDDGFLDKDAPEETGLFIVNLKKNTRLMLLSLARIAKENGQKTDDGYLHFVTHTEFSKDGRYISMLYRRIPRKGDYMKRWTRLLVLDRENDKLIVLPTRDSGSHYVWNSKNQIVASCIINNVSSHVIFDMADIHNPMIVAADKINSDGHQSFVDDDVFVTDTYPDRRRMARIWRVGISNGTSELLASIYSPKEFQTKDFQCHIACDIHPRVSPSGKYLCFDSPTTGIRSLWIMTLK